MNLRQQLATGALAVTIMRAGTSKGIFLHSDDLPVDPVQRIKVIEQLMGSDTHQMDGLGGGHLLSSKVALVSKSEDPAADIDCKFVQVVPGRGTNDTITCGNLMSAVGPYALENGMVSATDPVTTVRIRDVNTGALASATVSTPNGRVSYAGDYKLAGSDGVAAPIKLLYRNLVTSCEAMWPTGEVSNYVDSVAVTYLKVTIPLLIFNAKDVGLDIFPQTIRDLHNRVLIDNILSLRRHAMEQFGEPVQENSVVPKVALVSSPIRDGNLSVYYYTPHTPHHSLAVTGAITLATAAVVPGTVAHACAQNVANVQDGIDFVLEHISGKMEVEMEFSGTGKACLPQSAKIMRSARVLMRGTAYLP